MVNWIYFIFNSRVAIVFGEEALTNNDIQGEVKIKIDRAYYFIFNPRVAFGFGAEELPNNDSQGAIKYK